MSRPHTLLSPSVGDHQKDGRSFSTRAFFALLVGAAAIGFAPIFVRLSEVGPTSTAFWRVFLAQPFLWAIYLLQKRIDSQTPQPKNRRDLGWLFLAGSVFCFNSAIWHWSIRYTTVANATVFSNMAPLFVTLASYLLLGERVSFLFLCGLVLTLTGAVFLGWESFSLGWDRFLGDLLAILTAVFYAAYLMSVNHVRGKFSAPTVMAFAGVASSFWLFWGTLATESAIVPSTSSGWWVLFGLATVSHVSGQGLIAYGLGHLPTSLSSVTLLLQPVVAAIAAWGLLGEPMGGFQVLGTAVVLLGIYVARRGAW